MPSECRNHCIKVSDQTWESWQKLAYELGLSVTKTLVRAMANEMLAMIERRIDGKWVLLEEAGK